MFIFQLVRSLVNFSRAIFSQQIDQQIDQQIQNFYAVFHECTDVHTYIRMCGISRKLCNIFLFRWNNCFNRRYMLENISLAKMKFVLGSFQLTLSIDQTA